MKSNKVLEGVKTRAGWLIILLLIIVAAWYISAFHYQLMMIQGESMSPSFHHMQMVILDKDVEGHTYGDVIAFRCENLNVILVKRIAACPGDTVQISDGILLVNGVTSEIYGQEALFKYAGIAEEAVMLGDNQYFVIGDNVAESKDSRYEEIGIIYIKNIIGEIMTRDKKQGAR